MVEAIRKTSTDFFAPTTLITEDDKFIKMLQENDKKKVAQDIFHKYLKIISENSEERNSSPSFASDIITNVMGNQTYI